MAEAKRDRNVRFVSDLADGVLSGLASPPCEDWGCPELRFWEESSKRRFSPGGIGMTWKLQGGTKVGSDSGGVPDLGLFLY